MRNPVFIHSLPVLTLASIPGLLLPWLWAVFLPLWKKGSHRGPGQPSGEATVALRSLRELFKSDCMVWIPRLWKSAQPCYTPNFPLGLPAFQQFSREFGCTKPHQGHPRLHGDALIVVLTPWDLTSGT